MHTQDPFQTSEASVHLDKKDGMILTIPEQLKDLPSGVVLKSPPEEHKQKTQPKRARTQWAWIARMLPMAVGRWFLVQKNVGNKQAEYAIRDRSNAHIDPDRFEVRAVRTQSGPRLYDVYLRLRRPSEMGERQEEHAEWIRQARVAWKERYANGWQQQRQLDKAEAELRKIKAQQAEA